MDYADPGGTKVERLDNNLSAADVVLTEAGLQETDRASATIDIKWAALSESWQPPLTVVDR